MDTGEIVELSQGLATPHIAASTEEAQELVGLDTAAAVRDFLRDGVVRNAVNFPSVHPEELQRLQPWIRLADSFRRSPKISAVCWPRVGGGILIAPGVADNLVTIPGSFIVPISG